MISKWISKDFPYRPGAKRTGDRFGLRKDCIGSPFHAGDDRSGKPDTIVMPFDGTMIWKMADGTQWGSILRLIPDDSPETEIQVAHTVRTDGLSGELCYWMKQGEPLHVKAGALGYSVGAHTHTEWVIKYTKENYAYFAKKGTWIRDNNSLNSEYIGKHCKDYSLNEREYTKRLADQCNTWGIAEANTTFCVRSSLPGYRLPIWGAGSVIIADPMLYLDI